MDLQSPYIPLPFYSQGVLLLKKISKILFCLFLCFCLFGCGSDETSKSQSETVTSAVHTIIAENDNDASVADKTSKVSSTSSTVTTTNKTDNSNSKNKNSDTNKNTTAEKTNKNTNNTTKSTTKAATKKQTTTTSSTVNCTVTVECKKILSNMDNLKAGHEDFVPQSGVFFSNCSVRVKNGSSAYDAVKLACSNNGISVNATNSSYGIYIAGFNNIDEKDCGNQSGWTYTVNGKYISKSCGKYIVSNGDSIVFSYTC